VIELARALPGLGLGEVLEVRADDPAAAVDIPAWCRMRGHAYLGADPVDPGDDGGGPGTALAHQVRLQAEQSP
jgi:tRNA 2-thiouridine synthesizing protein A